MQHILTKSVSSSATEEVPSKYDLLNYATSGKSLQCQETDSSYIRKSGPPVDPLNNRVMLFDGTAIMYRSYYKLLGKVYLYYLKHVEYILFSLNLNFISSISLNVSNVYNFTEFISDRECICCITVARKTILSP